MTCGYIQVMQAQTWNAHISLAKSINGMVITKVSMHGRVMFTYGDLLRWMECNINKGLHAWIMLCSHRLGDFNHILSASVIRHRLGLHTSAKRHHLWGVGFYSVTLFVTCTYQQGDMYKMEGNIFQGLHASTMVWAHRLGDIVVRLHTSKIETVGSNWHHCWRSSSI